jgi:hypothetical protein
MCHSQISVNVLVTKKGGRNEEKEGFVKLCQMCDPLIWVKSIAQNNKTRRERREGEIREIVSNV